MLLFIFPLGGKPLNPTFKLKFIKVRVREQYTYQTKMTHIFVNPNRSYLCQPKKVISLSTQMGHTSVNPKRSYLCQLKKAIYLSNQMGPISVNSKRSYLCQLKKVIYLSNQMGPISVNSKGSYLCHPKMFISLSSQKGNNILGNPKWSHFYKAKVAIVPSSQIIFHEQYQYFFKSVIKYP